MWNRKKIMRFVALMMAVNLLIFSPAADYLGAKESYATGGVIEGVVGGTATVAVEYAIAYLLSLFGFVAASAAVYENADNIKAWGNEQMAAFYEYCQSINKWSYLTEDEINNWLDNVASGTLEKASDVWDAFRDWMDHTYAHSPVDAGGLYLNSFSAKYGYDPSSVEAFCIPEHYIFSFDDSGSDYVRENDCFFSTNDRVGAFISSSNSVLFYYFDIYGRIMSSTVFVAIYYNYKPTYSFVSCHSSISSNSIDFWDIIRNIPVPVYETKDELDTYLKTGVIGKTWNNYTDSVDESVYDSVGAVSGIYDRDKSLEHVDVINPGALAGDTALDIDWAHITDLVGTLEGMKEGTLDPADVWEQAGVSVVDTTQNPDGALDTDFPWFPDIVGWLRKIYNGIMSIPEKITDFFTIDTAAISVAYGSLADTFQSRFSGLSQISALFNFGDRNFDESPPVIMGPVPEPLKFAIQGDTMVWMDLRPFATQLKWCRFILTAAIWVLFIKWLLDQFDVKFTIG